MKVAYLVLVLIVSSVLSGGIARAEFRDFTDQKGRTMKAELVSRDGKGNVKLRRTDGKEFSVSPTVFSIDDQAFIRKWIESNPVQLQYRFDVEYKTEKLASQRRDFGYKKVKNQELAYKIELKNIARNPVGNLKAEYRVFTRNEADGSYSSYQAGGFYAGTAEIKGPIRYNEAATVTTLGVPIDTVDYDGAGSRYKDGLLGFMIRLKDPAGKVVLEFVSPTNTLKGRTWESISPKAELKLRTEE